MTVYSSVYNQMYKELQPVQRRQIIPNGEVMNKRMVKYNGMRNTEQSK